MTSLWKTAGVAFALAMVPAAASAQTIEGPQTAEEWFKAGKHTVYSAKHLREIVKGAKNVILFVGDGMGVSTVTAARILEGQLRGKTGEENSLSFEKFPYLALSKTYNTNAQTPDSAGTMTAMMTGIKTKAGVISMSPSVERQGECNIGDKLSTLLEQTAEAGMNVGVVSTARLTHATPAATYAHTTERNWERDSDVANAGTNCASIASQLVALANETSNLKVAMGGGRSRFSTANIDAWPGTLVEDKAAMLNPSNTLPLLGLFTSSHMSYEYDRPDTEPSLTDMTEKAINVLKNHRKGFFLHVESGRIDHAHHAGNAFRALGDTIEFSKAVKKAVEMTNSRDTLIIVTADHSHVFTIAGYPARGNDILGKVADGNGNLSGDSNGMPYTTLGYQNGPGYVAGARPDLSNVDTAAQGYRQEAAIPMGSETHAAEDVAIYAKGPMSHLFRNTVEQNVIYHVMREALKKKLDGRPHHPRFSHFFGHHRRW